MSIPTNATAEARLGIKMPPSNPDRCFLLDERDKVLELERRDKARACAAEQQLGRSIMTEQAHERVVAAEMKIDMHKKNEPRSSAQHESEDGEGKKREQEVVERRAAILAAAARRRQRYRTKWAPGSAARSKYTQVAAAEKAQRESERQERERRAAAAEAAASAIHHTSLPGEQHQLRVQDAQQSPKCCPLPGRGGATTKPEHYKQRYLMWRLRFRTSLELQGLWEHTQRDVGPSPGKSAARVRREKWLVMHQLLRALEPVELVLIAAGYFPPPMEEMDDKGPRPDVLFAVQERVLKRRFFPDPPRRYGITKTGIKF